MNYEEYLKLPDIHRAFDNMFEKQRTYYRLKSREYGINHDHAELFSIKMAYISADFHFTKQFYNPIREIKNPNPDLAEVRQVYNITESLLRRNYFPEIILTGKVYSYPEGHAVTTNAAWIDVNCLNRLNDSVYVLSVKTKRVFSVNEPK